MFIIGFQLKVNYPKQCATLPFISSQTGCTPVFLYALSYISLEKCISTYLGTRIRGVYNSNTFDTMINQRFMKDVYLVRVFGQLSNFVYVYKLLKKYQDLKFMVSYTRVQSRLTGYAC